MNQHKNWIYGWLSLVLVVATGCPTLSSSGGGSGWSQEAQDSYDAGYADGYYDAQNGLSFWDEVDPTPSPDSPYYYYDLGYTDGYADGSAGAGTDGGAVISDGGRTVTVTLPSNAKALGSPWLIEVTAYVVINGGCEEAPTVTILINGKQVAQGAAFAQFSTFPYLNDFPAGSYPAGTIVTLKSSRKKLTEPSSIKLLHPPDHAFIYWISDEPPHVGTCVTE